MKEEHSLVPMSNHTSCTSPPRNVAKANATISIVMPIEYRVNVDVDTPDVGHDADADEF